MIELTFGNISVGNIKTSSGVFIGKKNTHKNFRSSRIVNEGVGALIGNENKLNNNYWVKHKEKWEGE
ncbi:hypothetical protein QE429_003389 [Bacillus sp. SORGH_AS 510]|uniref:hypothetical protein n=1 Tax=Bacillus sp. SORGH_AS_0510 TaxID=3041771 RepID=UPI00277E1157|nr:hypothetical protein [Bacillus sp. SORGH_AS_0510]MDQ1146562.1 hypothetical protein [Bacillus sp. SORGH_AS_0510]